MGEYIKFSVTVFFLSKKYPKLIEITFFFSELANHSCLHVIAISYHHISLAARNRSFRLDTPQDGNFIFVTNLVVRRGKDLRNKVEKCNYI